MELTLGPLVLEATERVTVAVVGGPDGAFGLLPGERLKILPVGARAYLATGSHGPSRCLADPPHPDGKPLRVLPGPQAALLDFEALLRNQYTVGLASNRVGIRLEGEAMPHTLSLPSEPAVSGAVQIPPNGQPIVLGPDGPTIGGYPKIAVVISADLDRLGRLKPGNPVNYEEISLEGARSALRESIRERNRRIAELRIVQIP